MNTVQEKLNQHFQAHRKSWLKVLYVLGGLILFIILMDGVVMPIWTRHGDDTRVPNLVGLDLEKATDSLQAYDLRIEKVGEKFELNYPSGTVIFQIPDADSRVKKNQIVKVTLSKGGETVIVPQLGGQSYEQARLTLEEWGLKLGDVTYTESDSLPPQRVISSFPQAGSKVPAGMAINLIINQAQASMDSTLVPDLIGKNLDEGRGLLEASELKLHKVKEREEKELLPGTILAQSLEPGRKVPRGTEIDLIISALED
jgi:eukaryotic-like serine/threonine-protein kinase